MKLAPQTKYVMSATAAAKWLGISRRSFGRHVMPTLTHIVIGEIKRYSEDDLIVWVEQRKEKRQ